MDGGMNTEMEKMKDEKNECTEPEGDGKNRTEDD